MRSGQDFLKLVLIDTVIDWSVAYWAMDKWLQDFAYRISMYGCLDWETPRTHVRKAVSISSSAMVKMR